MTKMELLAPVGSSEALRAAVQNGADAVYFGGKLFNARQFADNFSIEEIKERVRYAHLRGVRVYVTVNTLLTNEELPVLTDYLYQLYEAQVDALIVQDLGAAELMRILLPHMRIHASTQMTIHNSPGVRFLQEWGFVRVVLAREVSLSNIARIKEKTDLPLEVFVHGALCVSYSGQCLMSSMIGGRSGNRGRCAQPCRLTYTLVDAEGKEVPAEGEHLLSPRDLKMIEALPLLAKAKVASLKVEGRMKRPEYVATVIRNYRQALDNFYANPEKYAVAEEAAKELAQIFNRDFTTGYFIEKPGQQLMSYQRPNNRGIKLGRVVHFDPRTGSVTVHLEEPLAVGDGYVIWVTKGGRLAGEIKSLKKGNTSIARAEGGEEVSFIVQGGRPHEGDRVFKTLDYALMEKATITYASARNENKEPLDFALQIAEGKPVVLEARDRQGNYARVEGRFIVEKARKHPLMREDIARQLQRLGDTVFCLGELVLQLETGLMVPLSELNMLRRAAVSQIEELRLTKFAKPAVSIEEYQSRVRTVFNTLSQSQSQSQSPANNRRKKVQLSIQVGDMASLEAALEAGAELLYFGGDRLRRKKGFAPEDFPFVVEKCHAKGARAVLVMPRIMPEEEVDRVSNYCLKGQEAGVDGFLAGNLGSWQIAKELGLSGLRADYTLNIFNNLTVAHLSNSGAEGVTLSPELTLQQINEFGSRGSGSKVNLECFVHGYLPLMITEHCTIGNILGKGHRQRGCPLPCEKQAYGLRDRLNLVFPVESDENCRMLIFNSKVLNMLGHLPELVRAGMTFLRIEARREESYWVKKVVQVYRRELDRVNRMTELGEGYQPLPENMEILQALSPAGLTKGHYFRGVE
jgi:putative protease